MLSALPNCGNTPFQPPLSFPSPLQHKSQVTTQFFSSVPSPHNPPAQGCCSPLLAQTQGNSGPFLSPSCTSPQFVTWIFSLSSFLVLSQQDFHTFHLIYNHVPRGVLSSRLEKNSACFTHLKPYTCSSLLTSLVPSVHLSPTKHKMLFSAALLAQFELQGLGEAAGLGWDEPEPWHWPRRAPILSRASHPGLRWGPEMQEWGEFMNEQQKPQPSVAISGPEPEDIQ